METSFTAIIAAGRNLTIDYNADETCDIVIRLFTCIKSAWNRVRNIFATVLTTITTIWRPGLKKLIITNPKKMNQFLILNSRGSILRVLAPVIFLFHSMHYSLFYFDHILYYIKVSGDNNGTGLGR